MCPHHRACSFGELVIVLQIVALLVVHLVTRDGGFGVEPPVPDTLQSESFLAGSILIVLAILAIMVRFIYYQMDLQKETLERINNQLKLQNRSLQSELRELRNMQTEEVLGTPAEKVIHLLRSLAGDPKAGISDLQRGDLHYVIRVIGSNKLYTSSVSYAALKPSENVDTETQKWVLDQLVQKDIEAEPEANTGNVADDVSNYGDNLALSALPGGTRQSLQVNRTGRRVSSIDFRKPSVYKVTMDRMSDRMLKVLEGIENWNFDIFEFDKLSHGQALSFLGFHLFQKHEFITEFNISEECLKRFLSQIQEGYINNPYHNSLHAGDVLQSYHSLVCNGGLAQHLEPAELLACLIATIVHDYRHPGVNNNYLMSVEDPIAITFNDTSVLENYHVSEAFKLMSQDEYNILRNVPKDMKKKIRKITIELVLATDMSRHADIMGALKNCLSVGTLNGETFDSRLLLMKLAMKLSDVSNPAKAGHVAQEWTRRVTDEFYSQGDKEREKGIPVSPFMDRGIPVTSKAQIGFISFVVQPLAELWNNAMGTGRDCIDNLTSNLEYWKRRLEEETIAETASLNQPTSITPTPTAPVIITTPATLATGPSSAANMQVTVSVPILSPSPSPSPSSIPPTPDHPSAPRLIVPSIHMDPPLDPSETEPV